MAVTYATVTSVGAGPGPRLKYEFYPETTNNTVTVAADNYTHVGPYAAVTNAQGGFTIALPSNTDQGGATLVWRIVETPLTQIPGRGITPRTIGYFTIPASIDYDDLIASAIAPTVVTPTIIENVGNYATDAQNSADAAAASAASVNREQANGVAGLDGTGKLYATRIPDLTATYMSRSARTQHIPALGLYFPEAEGAVADGVTNDTAAIQAALNAAAAAGSGARVHLGAATYLTGPLTVAGSGLTIEGVGPHLSTLQTATGDMFTLPAAATLTRLELRDIQLVSQAGGGHIINVPYGVNQSVFARVRFNQQNAAKSILKCDRTGATNGGLFDNHFVDCHFIMPTTSTAYGFDVKGDGNCASANLWDRCRVEGGGTYMFSIETLASGTWCYNNTWSNLNFESVDHGGIRLRSAMNAAIDKVGFFDNGTINTDLISIGRTGTANQSRGNRITSVHRSGGTLSGAVDIILRSGENNGTTTIMSVTAPIAAGFTVDLGSSNGRAVMIGHDPSQVAVLNAVATSSVVITSDNGAQVPKLTVGGVQFLSGTGSPEGSVTGTPGDLYQRLTGTGGGGQSRLFIKETGTATNTGWRAVNIPPSATTAAFISAANAVNTGGKVAGAMAWNTTLNRPVWATGSATTSTWVYADGTTAHTPA